MANGSIILRGDKYYAYWTDPSGKRKGKVIGPRKKEAQEFLRKVHLEMRDGSYVSPSKMRWEEFVDKWLAEYARLTYKPDSYKAISTWISSVLRPAFAGKQVSRVSTSDLQGFYATLTRRDGQPLAPASIRRYHNVVLSMFSVATDWEMVSRNPATGVRLPRVEHKEMIVLSPQELRAFLAEVPDTYRDLFSTLAYTGLRFGEALALEWDHIDFDLKTVRVVSGKTHNARRTVPMPKTLAALLRERHRALGCPTGGLVFPSEAGGRLNAHNLRHRVFQRASVRAGLGEWADPENERLYRGFRIHDLRHTYASMLIANNESPKLVSMVMGHGSIRTTYDRYGHLFPDAKQDAGDRLDALISA